MNIENFKIILSDVNDFAKRYFGGEWDGADASVLAADYYKYIEPNKSAFFSLLNDYFLDDKELMIMILSALFQGSHDVWCLDRLDEVNLSSDLQFDFRHALWIDSYSKRFKYGLPNIAYDLERQLISLMVNSFSKTIDFDNLKKTFLKCDAIQRNVVIIAEQLLTIEHAPTHAIVDFCKIYTKSLGYNVFLLILAEGKSSEDFALNNIFDPYIFNYNNGLWGDAPQNLQLLDGITIKFLQTIISVKSPETVKRIIREVYNFQPSYIINIGSTHMIAELLGQYFPLASLSLNAGLATSSASFLIRLARSENHLQETFALNNGQKIIDLNYRIIGSNEDVLLSRSEIGASEDVFLIVVMGNRLDTEINEEFIDVMMQIVQRNEQVRFMLIGDHSIDFTKYGLDSCVISLGYRKDYMAILKVADMFLNPKRAGGGTGGQNAVLLGVPVITLPNCDVASLLDEPEFICSNYAEFPKCVTKYINDADYHKKVDEACLRVQKKYKKLDNENEIIRMNAIIQDCITKSKKN